MACLRHLSARTQLRCADVDRAPSATGVRLWAQDRLAMGRETMGRETMGPETVGRKTGDRVVVPTNGG